MMKWIRPSGAIVFLVLALTIGLFWWLLADWLLKTSIEKVGTKVVGAKVEVAAADLTFSPLGFHLDKLQITNPQQPMQNLMELQSTTGNLELLPLLMGQVIVDDLSATGVRFNTERAKSGAISKPTAKTSPVQEQPGKSALELGAIKDKLPSVDELMAKEPLATVQQTEAVQQHIKTQRSELEHNIASLPEEQKIKHYEQRLKETTGGKIQSLDEMQQREKDLEKLKDEIRADRDVLIKVRDQVRGAKEQLNSQYKALKQAPAEDWNRIKTRYGLNSTGAGNITGLLFGETAKTWLERLLTWTTQAKRMLPGGDGETTPEPVKPARGEGRFIRFPTANPLPDFLIRKALLTLDLNAGNIELSVKDATHQPQVLGRPMLLHASGKNLEHAEQIQIDGIIDHVHPQSATDSLQWSVTGWQLADIALSKDSTLPLTLSKARAELSGKVQITGDALAANIDAIFNNSQWNSPAQEGWQGRVVKTLAGIKQFRVDGNISGDLNSPQLSFRSDLDEQLKQAVAGQLKNAQAELEQKLKTRLNAEVEKAAGPYNDQLTFLIDSEGSIDQRINQLDEMLKAELKSAVDSKKQEATDKLKDQLKGLKF